MRLLSAVLLALLWSFSCGGPVSAQELGQAAAPGQEPVEEIENVEAVTEIQAAAEKPTTIDVLMGRLHPALVHLPIGWLLATLLLDFLGLCLNRTGFHRAGLVLLLVAALSCMPAMVSGWLRASELASGGPSADLVISHRNLMIGVSSLVVLALGLRLWRKNQIEGLFRWIYLGMILIGSGLIGFGGHLGGKLVFGANFLPF